MYKNNIDLVNEPLSQISDSFMILWESIANYIPTIFVAVIVFIIGLIVADVLSKFIEEILRKIKLDVFLEKINLKSFLEKTGYRLNSPVFFGRLVKWFTIIVFLLAVLDVLNLAEIKVFVYGIGFYLLKIIVALIILVIAAYIARFVKNILSALAKASDVKNHKLIGDAGKWIVYFLTLVTVLNLFAIFDIILGYLSIIITGIVFALALAFGLSFGMGGKDYARKKIEEKLDK